MLFELGLVQLLVVAVFLHQLIVRAPFNNLAIIYHQNLVRIMNCLLYTSDAADE